MDNNTTENIVELLEMAFSNGVQHGIEYWQKAESIGPADDNRERYDQMVGERRQKAEEFLEYLKSQVKSA